MSNRVVEIQEHIAATERMLKQLQEAMLVKKPTASILANVRSLEKRRLDLESQFLEAAKDASKDVCAVRWFAEDRQPSAAVIGKAVSLFQDLTSVAYAAVSEGKPRENTNVGGKLREQSAFGIGYTFPGSVGVVLTLTNEQGLFDDLETSIDDAIKTVFNMLGSENKEQVAEFSRELGPGPVRALKKFTEHLVRTGFGFDAEWRRVENVKASIETPLAQLDSLLSIINETSTEETEEIKVTGILEAFDSPGKRFKIHTPEEEMLSGEVADYLLDRKWVINRSHKATITTTRIIRFSTETIETKVKLIKLVPLD